MLVRGKDKAENNREKEYNIRKLKNLSFFKQEAKIYVNIIF